MIGFLCIPITFGQPVIGLLWISASLGHGVPTFFSPLDPCLPLLRFIWLRPPTCKPSQAECHSGDKPTLTSLLMGRPSSASQVQLCVASVTYRCHFIEQLPRVFGRPLEVDTVSASFSTKLQNRCPNPHLQSLSQSATRNIRFRPVT